MNDNGLTIRQADRLPGEAAELRKLFGDFSDHARKRNYADWLSRKGDDRGDYFNAVLDAWEDGGTIPLDDSFSEVWRNTCGVTLLLGLRQGGLNEQADAICKLARPALELTPALSAKELPIGVTKFGGKPDLPPGVNWPEYEGKIHSFIGQINLAEIAGTQAARELPKTGLLSIFVFDDYEQMEVPGPVTHSLVYFPDASHLNRLDPPKEFDESNRLAPECRLTLRETLDLPYVDCYSLEDSYADKFVGCQRAKAIGLTKEMSDCYEELLESLLPEREERSHFLGWSHPQVLADDPVDPGFRHLLTVASEEVLEWCWADGHQLFFSLPEEDFPAHRFDRFAVTDG